MEQRGLAKEDARGTPHCQLASATFLQKSGFEEVYAFFPACEWKEGGD